LFLFILYVFSFIPIAIAQQQRSSGFFERRYYYPVDTAFVLLITLAITTSFEKMLQLLKNQPENQQ
jgi:hypothetical protein